MNNKSIDGLQRRNTGGTKKATGISRSSASSFPKRQTASKKTNSSAKPRRKIGLPDEKAELKAIIAEGEKLERLNSSKKAEVELLDDTEEQDERTNDVKEFLSEVKDVDPTDLVEVPQSEKTKGWSKKSKKSKRNKGEKKSKKWIILLVILAIILGGGFWLYNYLNDFVSTVTDGGNIVNVLFSDPDTPLQKDENGRTNILVFGTEGYAMDDPKWDGGYLTDSMMMLSVDQETGDVKAASLPRDLKAKTCTSTSKINEVFWCKYNKVNPRTSTAEEKRKYEEEGAAALEQAFEEVFGVEIQYHAHANWQALIQIVDALGGVDVVFTYGDQTWDGDEVTIVTTDKRGLADGPRGKYHIQVPNGQVVHLNGEQALAVARARNAYGGYGAGNGNFSREYFQQRILEAIAKKARSKKLDLATVLGIKTAVGDNLRTNFKDVEIKTLVKLATKLDFSGIQTISLFDTKDKPAPLLTTGMINGISYVYPSAGVGNYSAIHKYMKRKLSTEVFAAEEANIIVLNGTAATGIAGNEKTYLEGKGYLVSKADNAPASQGGFDGVKVFQIASNKPKTAEALAKLYNIELITEIPEALANYKCDFIVIVGNGLNRGED